MSIVLKLLFVFCFSAAVIGWLLVLATNKSGGQGLNSDDIDEVD